jgi:folate-binding protein YgfZ
MIASYGDVEAERNLVRERCGIIDLSNRGGIRFTGKDRQSFLQGMLSNDTRRLEPGQGIYATFLEPKGHMLGDLTLYAFDDYYFADTEPGMENSLVRALDRYLIREKVKIAGEGDSSDLTGLSGPKAKAILAAVFPDLAPIAGPFGCAVAERDGAAVEVMRRDFTGEESFLLRCEPEAAAPLWKALTEAGAEPFGQEALEVLRVEAGIPRYGVDTSQETIPLEAGLFFGISRDKGCYVGQEIIERIASRGHTNRRLLPIRFAAGPVPTGRVSLFLGEKEVGYVTSGVASPGSEGPVGLGYLRREAAAPGTRLRAVWEGGEIEAEPLSRPLFGSGEPPAITNAEPNW